MQRYRFIHIAKTAGITLSTAVRRNFPQGSDFWFYGDMQADINRFKALPRSRQDAIRVFFGHAPISLGLEEADKVELFTLLREPVARVKSFIYHVAEGKSPQLKALFPPNAFSVDKLLDSQVGELRNLQTKMLINHRQGCAESMINRLSPEEAAELALNNLFNRVSVYGIQEYFSESLIVIAKHFDWKIPYYKTHNTRDRALTIDFQEHHLEKIRELNAIDLAVYEAALKRFEEILKTTAFSGLKHFLLKSTNFVGSRVG